MHSRGTGRRDSTSTQQATSPRPILPSLGELFPRDPSIDHRTSSMEPSRRTSNAQDPFFNGRSSSREVLATSPIRRTSARSPPRLTAYQDHQAPSMGPGWIYPSSAFGPPSRQLPTTSSSLYVNHPSETHHTYHPNSHSRYLDRHGSNTAQIGIGSSLATSSSSSSSSYGEPYQYAWSMMPGAGEYPSQRRRRGNLPREATNMLKNWFNEHRSSPYPSEEEKTQFCELTGLSMNQVCHFV